MVSSLYKRIELSIFQQKPEIYLIEEIIERVERIYGNFASEKESVTIPIEGEWFDIDPLTLIEQECFQHERSNWSEEKTRKEILEAFEEARKNPERYLKKFKTIIPVKTWNGETTEEKCIQVANEYKGQIADWVEQRLQWAQCIINNEYLGWKTVCNRLDTAKNYRIIKDKDGQLKRVGGSNQYYFRNECNLPTTMNELVGHTSWETFTAVPLVVNYNNSSKKKDFIPANESNKIILSIKGKKMIFSKEELEAIIELYMHKVFTKMPIENEWLKVNPIVGEADMRIFEAEYEYVRMHRDQIFQRKLLEWILEEIKEIKKNPSKYSKPFKIMFPTKIWEGGTTRENIEQISQELGDHMADHIEVALLMMQILKEKSSIEMFRYTDTANWYRLFKKDDIHLEKLGDSIIQSKMENMERRYAYPTLHRNYDDSKFHYCVPLIVSYDD